MAGTLFSRFLDSKKSPGDKSRAGPYSSRYVDSISDMKSGPAVDLLVARVL